MGLIPDLDINSAEVLETEARIKAGNERMARKVKPQTGFYCPIAREVVVVNNGRVCSGEMHVKGDGRDGPNDIYGEPYIRLCKVGGVEGGGVYKLDKKNIRIKSCEKPKLDGVYSGDLSKNPFGTVTE